MIIYLVVFICAVFLVTFGAATYINLKSDKELM